ncbi:hypothetical protein BABINDRAFT_160620 [Babjeviella inositovora NRRL Y-12698]|uniref:Uncharacterized protein n=1 Tax=Babjeviella inositovora NRRL Y-12698 TaxID=984486 RepID=A0A1E3QU82_9ASCO|nr:uncharacterized protein BABINDRAFT_160620 [Babjeviella inositovora NRRL Y-12698]ODQ81241.1 hypothetical protein BABINDRAFT_160620 [Babjeviella inositovora NRRL Y-12698]
MSFSDLYDKAPGTAIQIDEDLKQPLMKDYEGENFSSLSDPEKGQPQLETPRRPLKALLKALLVSQALLYLIAAILVTLMTFFASDKFMKYVAHNYRLRSFTNLATMTSAFCLGTAYRRNPNSMAYKILLTTYTFSTSAYLTVIMVSCIFLGN